MVKPQIKTNAQLTAQCSLMGGVKPISVFASSKKSIYRLKAGAQEQGSFKMIRKTVNINLSQNVTNGQQTRIFSCAKTYVSL